MIASFALLSTPFFFMILMPSFAHRVTKSIIDFDFLSRTLPLPPLSASSVSFSHLGQVEARRLRTAAKLSRRDAEIEWLRGVWGTLLVAHPDRKMVDEAAADEIKSLWKDRCAIMQAPLSWHPGPEMDIRACR